MKKCIICGTKVTSDAIDITTGFFFCDKHCELAARIFSLNSTTLKYNNDFSRLLYSIAKIKNIHEKELIKERINQ